LPDGRFLAFASMTGYGPRKQLVVVEADRTTRRRLAFGREPDPSGAVMVECRGSYFVDKRVSPDSRWVAARVASAYGPRCDSPVF
jgi:hypothetical protein